MKTLSKLAVTCLLLGGASAQAAPPPTQQSMERRSVEVLKRYKSIANVAQQKARALEQDALADQGKLAQLSRYKGALTELGSGNAYVEAEAQIAARLVRARELVGRFYYSGQAARSVLNARAAVVTRSMRQSLAEDGKQYDALYEEERKLANTVPELERQAAAGKQVGLDLGPAIKVGKARLKLVVARKEALDKQMRDLTKKIDDIYAQHGN